MARQTRNEQRRKVLPPPWKPAGEGTWEMRFTRTSPRCGVQEMEMKSKNKWLWLQLMQILWLWVLTSYFWTTKLVDRFADGNFVHSLPFAPKPEVPRIFHGLEAYPEFFFPPCLLPCVKFINETHVSRESRTLPLPPVSFPGKNCILQVSVDHVLREHVSWVSQPLGPYSWWINLVLNISFLLALLMGLPTQATHLQFNSTRKIVFQLWNELMDMVENQEKRKN